jgi:hypothetical protein
VIWNDGRVIMDDPDREVFGTVIRDRIGVGSRGFKKEGFDEAMLFTCKKNFLGDKV